jgi:hypothetical protein
LCSDSHFSYILCWDNLNPYFNNDAGRNLAGQGGKK